MNMSLNSTKLLSSALLGSVLGFCAAMVSAQGLDADPSAAKIDNSIRLELEARIAEIKTDERVHALAREEGRARTVLCKTCHGEDGKSVKEGVPNLAAQNPAYIVDQFSRFADGRRNDFMMSNLAKTFDREDVVKIALYFSDLPGQVFGGGRKELIPEGEKLFQERCSRCHGEDGRGHEGYARLAGQRPDYVVKMLKEFKNQTGRRINPWMTGVAVGLDNQQIEAIAAYVANMN